MVLPAALWGEKTGTFTNVDRTVHLSEKAVDPPGEARSDLDIFLDYARRMGFRDRERPAAPALGRPRGGLRRLAGVLPWAAVRLHRASATTLLRGSGGIQWPCTTRSPDGHERLYADGVFPTDAGLLRDLRPRPAHRGVHRRDGAPRAATSTAGRCSRRAVYRRRHEQPDDDYPLRFTTGRTVYHFHTRTKTGRAEQLDAAAPDAWVEISPEAIRGLVLCQLVQVGLANVRALRTRQPW